MEDTSQTLGKTPGGADRSNSSDGKRAAVKAKKITAQEFESETSDPERLEIARALSQQIVFLIAADRPVYLEGFGILVPNKQLHTRSSAYQDKVLYRTETVRTAKFEKCSELVAFQRERYPKIVDTHELTQLCYTRLPLEMQIKWSDGQTRRLFCGLINKILREVVISGTSKTLSSLGVFYASHNRQGATLADWFAGADIFFESAFEHVVKLGPSHVVEPLILRDSLELLEAGFGAPIQKLTLNLRDQLSNLGSAYNLDQNANYHPEVTVAVFAKELPNSEKRLFYCTEGMRNLHIATRQGEPGAEFVVQISINPDGPFSPGVDSVPLWPLRAITLAWLLLESSKTKVVKAGAGLSLGCRIKDDDVCEQKTILLANFSACPETQQSESGKFNYFSICGVCDDEAQVAKSYGADYLLSLLKHRKLDQILRPNRASVVGKRALPEPSQVN